MKRSIEKGPNYFSTTFNGCRVKFHFPYERRHDTNLVYVLRFPNGKYYVGQTVAKDGIIERVKKHCHEEHRVSHGALRTHKTNIIRKYGEFDVFIQHRCLPTEDVDFFEQFFICLLSKRIINISSGGQNGYRVSDEHRKHLSSIMTQYYKDNPQEFTPVYCYSIAGDFIKKFVSTGAAARELGCDHRLIWSSCRKHAILQGKYQMRYEGDDDVRDMSPVMKGGVRSPQKDFFILINGEKHIVNVLYKYSLDGKYLCTVPVREMTRLDRNLAHRAIKDGVTALGYQWHYEKKECLPAIKPRYERASHSLSYALIQMNIDGEPIYVWGKTSDAAKTLGIRAKGIQSVCCGKKRTYKGFIWKYI